MFLLNRELIKQKELITGDLNDLYFQTGYYFRFGRSAKVKVKGGWDRMDLEANRNVMLPGRGFLKFETLETFRLPSNIWAIFGNTSNVVEECFSLIHGPFIEPWFGIASEKEEGVRHHLELGISNLSDEPLVLNFKQVIGKVSFFDVSDTYPLERPAPRSVQGIHRMTIDKRKAMSKDGEFMTDIGDVD